MSKQLQWGGTDAVQIQALQAEWHELSLLSAQRHRGDIDLVHAQLSQHGPDSADSEGS